MSSLKRKSKLTIYGIAATLLVVGVGSIVAFSLLKPANTNNTSTNVEKKDNPVEAYEEGDYQHATDRSMVLLENQDLDEEDFNTYISIAVNGLVNAGKKQEALERSKQLYENYDIKSYDFFLSSGNLAEELGDAAYAKTMFEQAISEVEKFEDDPLKQTTIDELQGRINNL